MRDSRPGTQHDLCCSKPRFTKVISSSTNMQIQLLGAGGGNDRCQSGRVSQEVRHTSRFVTAIFYHNYPILATTVTRSAVSRDAHAFSEICGAVCTSLSTDEGGTVHSTGPRSLAPQVPCNATSGNKAACHACDGYPYCKAGWTLPPARHNAFDFSTGSWNSSAWPCVSQLERTGPSLRV